MSDPNSICLLLLNNKQLSQSNNALLATCSVSGSWTGMSSKFSFPSLSRYIMSLSTAILKGNIRSAVDLHEASIQVHLFVCLFIVIVPDQWVI